MTAQREQVVVQQYGPEYAGEHVAFADIRRTPEDVLLAYVHLGQVGAEGAMYGYESIGSTITAQRRSDIAGFGDFVGVELGWSEKGTLEHVHGNMKQENPQGRRDTRVFAESLHYRPTVGYGSWYLGRANVIEGLQQELGALDASWAFPTLYLHLNRLAEGSMQLASPAMADVTAAQLTIATNLERALVGSTQANAKLREDLTIFSGIHPDVIVDHYTSIRSGSRAAIRQASAEAMASPLARHYPRIEVYDEDALSPSNVLSKISHLNYENGVKKRDAVTVRKVVDRMRSLSLLEKSLAEVEEQ